MRSVVEAFRVPRRERAQLVDDPFVVARRTRLVDALVLQHVDVVEEEASAVVERHVASGPAGGELFGLRENPRIAQDAASDEHAVDARSQLVDDLLRLDTVAAAEHRDANVVGDPRDELPVRAAAVALRRRTAVDRDCGGARVLDHLREPRGVAFGVVPSRAHLHRHRNLHGPGHRVDDARRLLRLAHQAAAGVVLRDLRHRTAHVDVDDVGAHALDDLRGCRHLVGIAAEDLNRDRPFFFRVLGVLERPVDAAHESLRADHLGDDEAAAAVALDEASERRVGHARHRGYRERGREFDRANLHTTVKYPNRRCDVYGYGHRRSSTWRSARLS